jgi:hypothetical protein
MIIVVFLMFVMPVVTAVIPVSVMVAVTIPQMISAVIAIMVSVFCKGKSTEDQGQAQKNY